MLEFPIQRGWFSSLSFNDPLIFEGIFQHHLITQFISLGYHESFPEFHDVGTNLQQHLAAGVKLRHYLGARKLPQEDRDLKNAWEHLEQDARERCKIYVRVNQV